MKIKLSQRAVSIILCVALLMAYVPMAAYAAEVISNRVADPSTMDGWRQIFLSDELNTENAGGVWTDKSVFTDASAFSGTGITHNGDSSFLVALSAMASNMTVTGMSNVPTDTMMILDLSSSMYDGYDRNPSVVQTMLASVNESIEKLQNLNEHNRVGVVIYYGGQNRLQSDSSNSMVLLPLDRYSGTSTYLKANVTNGRLISVSVSAGVKNASGAAVPQTTRTVTDVAGTYAQLGILDAMDQLLQATTTIPAAADVTRVPVMIFMSDGEPTAATHKYTQKADAGMGNNTVHIRSANETDFVTQLTAAYAKEMVDAHYAETEPLFYTLSLGSSVSLAVMDPATNTSDTIDGYWTKLLSDGSVNITVYNSPDTWRDPSVKKTYTVSQTTVNGTVFPSGKLQRNYVDKTFTAANAAELTSAFDNIVNHISVVSKYTPTLTSGNADLSGYISFVDNIGEYMEVTDIKGILINNTLYSGEDLAKNFVADGGDLGTYDQPTALGDEMVWAVQARLGLESADAARTLIGLAYEHGQLSYTSQTEYSNYIGWYANAAGEFLGFWHKGITTMPDPTGNADTDPAYIIKSYGYLGAVDESHGVEASDMMYATVQVRESIATGEQTVVFAVPAALIPIVTYEVTLDQDNELSGLTVTGANHPIRLVYEVALNTQINSFNLKDTVSAEYLAANTDSEGNVSFYTNRYEVDNSTGYGKINTYSYFNPSRQNDKYYYLENAPVYTDTNGTLYTGSTQPKGTYYRSYTVYEKDGTALNKKTVYRRLSDEALSTAKQADNGSWYIGAGNIHVNLDGYTITKTENTTGTLPDANIPFVDANNHSVGDLGYNFIVGATLGNNGKLTMAPETGIALSKTMAQGATAPTSAFRFTVTNTSDAADNGTYPAQVLHADGTRSSTVVRFSGGKATVALNAGETVYIGGMTGDTTYQVEEVATLEYIPQVSTVTVTLERGEMTEVRFINSDRGSGNLTISKEVIHTLGSNYTIPEAKCFTVDVTLSGVGVANATFDAAHTDGTVTSVTTDANGSFTVTLSHDEQIEIFGLPAGTTAAVTERDPGTGFTAAYWENGETGDGVVTIPAGSTASVIVTNTYESEEVSPVNVVLYGSKIYTTAAADWNGAVFEFQLQKWTEDGWSTVAAATATESSPTFNFNAAMSAEKFTAPGTYYYQVMETNGGQTVNGITYDATLHTFGITVTDKDMDGKLEIDKVTSYHSGREFSKNSDGDWQIDITFHNQYDAAGTDLVLDVKKELVNLSGSPLVDLSGFQFGLYDGDDLIAVSDLTDGVGEARFILHYELEDAGIHTYTLKEIVPQNPIKNMTYTTASYIVVVEVTDNADGTTSAAIVSIDGETDYAAPVFTNIYKPHEAELEIDFVKKKLTGRDLVPGEFTFELRGTDRSITGTNDAEGNIIFEETPVFDKVGTWFFDLAETSTDGKGVTTDKTVYNITVTVTDKNGQLVADHHVLNVVEETVLFENTYTAKETSYTVGGKKVLKGRVLLNDEFTFVLTDENGEVIDETKNFTNGTFSFAPISFTKDGVYTYTVSEKANSSAAYGIIYDTTVYKVTVTVIDDLEGDLAVSDVTVTGGETDSITFTNNYVPDSTSAQISGKKILNGKVLNAGDFSFELYESDGNWTEGDKLETVQNGADGSFTFSKIDYDTAGICYYLVKEVNGGQTVDGVIYDDTVYRVKVEITDDLLGQLHAAIHIYNSDGIPRQDMEFVNIYTVTGDANVKLEGTKTLKGRDLADGEFTFELYATDESFAVSGEPIQTAVNQGNKFELNLSCTADDVGTTRYYVVKEQNAGETIRGVTYDDTVYRITVDVTDNLEGQLAYTLDIRTSQGIPQERVTFENTFTPDPDNVTVNITAQKTVKNIGTESIGPEGFEFLLENMTVGGIKSAKSNADGQAVFTLTFTKDDIGKIYTYKLSEVNGEKANVEYSTAVYNITVAIELNEENKLVAAIINNGAEVAEAVAEFENIYNYTPSGNPKTGDAGLELWISMLAVSCGGVITLIVYGNKKKDEE